MSGLDPLTSGSINNEDPVPKGSFFRSIGDLFKCSGRRISAPRNVDGGYVEFGDITCEMASQQNKVGTFAGVFCPVVLSMFSALVFIRMGFIIGNAGLLVTLMQFGISYVILIFTVCSVCAISTNGAIEGGGVYFMISRSLGPEFGGAIGTLFFFANIVSSALCFSACTEGLIENFGPSGYLISEGAWRLAGGRWWRALYGSGLAVLALGISLAGARYFARASLAIWFAVSVSLASVMISFLLPGEKQILIPESNTLVNTTFANYTGLTSETLISNLWPDYGRDYSSDGQVVDFATVFGVLFSGVTGVMAGANMSGELRSPGRSIPRGTLAALVFTGLTYLGLTLFTAASCSRFLLQNNYIYMLPINFWPPFVAVGVLTATFSAGLSNMIGASRVLEALVKDNLFGALLRWCTRPAICVLVSWFGVQAALLGGSLTAIARANCALFLLSYLAVNLACLALELAGAPNFRPSFKWFSWQSALCGLCGALAMMFVAASALAGAALILCLILVIGLHLASPAAAAQPWGSISQALIFHQVRKYLLLLDTRKEHVKYWRPQILLLVGSARGAPPLASFANHLKKGGLLVLGHVSSADPPVPLPHKPWLQLVDHLRIKAFVELCLADSVRSGARQLAHLSGLGAMKPNTLMLGFHGDNPLTDFLSREDSPFHSASLEASFPPLERHLSGPAEFVSLLADIIAMEKNLCLCRHFHNLDMNQVTKTSNLKYIDIWLSDFASPSSGDPFSVSGLFVLQLACILNTQASWRRLKLRVMLTDTADIAPTGSSSFLFNQGGSVNTVNSVHRDSLLEETHGSGNVSGCTSETEAAVARLASSVRPAQIRLSELLKLLRIQATVHKVVEWTDKVERLREDGIHPEGYQYSGARRYDLPQAYIDGVNNMIKSYSSSETAVVFIFLPPPPRESDNSNSRSSSLSPSQSILKDPFGLAQASSDLVSDMSGQKIKAEFAGQKIRSDHIMDSQEKERILLDECPERKQYLLLLKGLTDDLPPTVMVHGLKAVTSTLL